MAVYRVRMPTSGNPTTSKLEVAQAGSLNAGYKMELFFEATEFPSKGPLEELVKLLADKIRESPITGVT